MKINVGTPDRAIRLIISAVFVVLFLTSTITGLVGYVLLALAGIFSLTAVIGFCPIYSLVGVSTCKTSDSKKSG